MRADAQRNRARILDAAEQVFAAEGAGASTEEVARLAGVAIGTVFRHFPAKDDLLTAIMKRLLARLIEQAGALSGADGLFTFFTELVSQAAQQRTVITLTGVDLGAAMGALDEAVGRLLGEAQAAHAVRAELGLSEVMALLTSLCAGALRGGWGSALQHRTLAVVFAGMKGTRG
ncbi:TetR/AcrR family transcriptional regulator [Actinoplanes sp. TFC3]|uniref:TetR/AcrR family transcriptional regulator n=1 Tax=Actinoplanes sp. TFC3 TaxID=1710355 RepID=UPI0008338410|nr:helix-turn-helix domain-containing protein [Actinoplanes sp. TFC3]